MKKNIILLFLTLAVALTAVGCANRQNKMAKKIDEMAAKPAASQIESAKALYDEARKTVSWLEAHPEDAGPGVLDKARDLRNRRFLEVGKVAGGAVLEGFNKLLGGLVGATDSTGAKGGVSAVSVGQALDKAVDKILGSEEQRKKFGCTFPDGVTPLTEGASKFCK